MHVSNATVPTAAARGEERLPEGIIRVHPNVTMTAPTAGLRSVEEFTYQDYWARGDIRAVRFAAYVPCNHYFESGMMWQGNSFAEALKNAANGPIHIIAMPEGEGPADWHERMFNADGDERLYSEHPWRHYGWWRDNWARWVEHFPKGSFKLPGLLSYFQSPEKRARNIRTPIKPGKYLKKFFGDVLTEEEIQQYAIEWSSWATPPILKVTQDADEIEEVYVNGPRSCMSGQGFETGIHPSRVYAGPDLAVAYIGDLDGADARAVVWPEKKIYSRVYGDYHRMNHALAVAGYREGSIAEFRGARLRRILDGRYFVVPYVDFTDSATDDGEFLVADGRGNVYLRNTNGISGELEQCYYCEEVIGPDDDTYETARGRTICEHCRDTEYFECSVMGELYPNDELEPSHEDYPVSGRGAQSVRVFFCDFTEKYYPTSEFNYTVLADGRFILDDVRDEHFFLSDYSEEWFDLEDKVELSDGRVLAWSEWEGFSSRTAALEWADGATPVGRDDHPDQLTFDADLAVAA